MQSHRGDFNQPFAETEIRAKFQQLAGEVLNPRGVAEAETAINQCANWDSMTPLTAILRRHSLPT